MRAIIRIHTTIAEERIDDILKKHGWLPRLDEADAEGILDKHRSEILNTVHEDDLPIVKATLLPYVLYDASTKTWGIINEPADNQITFRLKNPIPDRLKLATEKLVKDLQESAETDSSIKLEFRDKIEVLEPGGFMHAFSGDVLPKARFRLAVKLRRTESFVGLIAFLASIFLLLLTIPPIRTGIFANGGWGLWTVGFLERLSTSAIVTATVSWLNVILYWFELRRQPTILWEA